MKKTILLGLFTAVGILLHAQNVGIGTTTPTRARLEVNGAVDATSAIFGGESSGISLQRNWPAVGYNQYYSGGHRRLATGFSALQVFDPNSGYLAFDMGPTGTAGSLITSRRVMSISNTGNIFLGAGNNYVGINSSSPTYTLEIRQAKDEGGVFERGLLLVSPRRNFDNWEFLVARSGGNDLSYLYFNFNGSNRVFINPTNGDYNTISDSRLKTNVRNVPSIINKIMQLRPVEYEMIDTAAHHFKNVGFIAQEVKPLFPHLVNITMGKVKSTDNITDLHTMNYAGFGVLAIKAIQEQQLQIEELKKDKEELKARLDKLEQLLTNK